MKLPKGEGKKLDLGFVNAEQLISYLQSNVLDHCTANIDERSLLFSLPFELSGIRSNAIEPPISKNESSKI